MRMKGPPRPLPRGGPAAPLAVTSEKGTCERRKRDWDSRFHKTPGSRLAQTQPLPGPPGSPRLPGKGFSLGMEGTPGGGEGPGASFSLFFFFP